MTPFIKPRYLRERYYSNDVMRTLGMKVWPQMFEELIGGRDLIWLLAKRNISVKYRQSILSYLWIIIPPVVAVSMFSYLSNHRIINVAATPLPYLSYALLNISIWLLFSTSLLSATKSLVEAGTLVTRVNFPKSTLVIASLCDAVLEVLVRIILVLVVFYIQDVTINWQIIVVPLLLIPPLMLALGLGFLFAILNLVVRDTVNILGIILTVGMFLTPVLYPPPVTEPFVYLNLLNPISPVLENIQSLVATGTLSDWRLLTITCVFSFLLLMAGWRIFNLTLSRINERA